MQNSFSDATVDTIVPIGVMGSGKSSLSNILSLKDNQTSIPDKTNQIFPVGAGEKAMTEEARPSQCSWISFVIEEKKRAPRNREHAAQPGGTVLRYRTVRRGATVRATG